MWTPERKALCAKLWLEGFSASKIAEQLKGVTRNGVIGQMYRSGIKRSPEITRQNRSENGKASQAGRRKGKSYPHSLNYRRSTPKPKPLKAPTPADAEMSLGLTLLEMRPFGQCKFGTHEGAGEHRFCGHPTIEGSPYCGHHHARCYIAARAVKLSLAMAA